jgi:hypothetical protein
MLSLRLAKVIYIYRDPRDVLISATDHGKKILAEGKNHTFAQMVDFDKAVASVKQWLTIWHQYSVMPNVLSIKYEDLMQQPAETCDRICNYLGIKISRKEMDDILFKYDKKNANADMRGLHFNQAKLARYKEEFTTEQLEKANTAFGPTMVKMGYQVS